MQKSASHKETLLAAKKDSRFEEFSMKAFPAIWHQRISRFMSYKYG